MGGYRCPLKGERVKFKDGAQYPSKTGNLYDFFLDGKLATVIKLDAKQGCVWVMPDDPLPGDKNKHELIVRIDCIEPVEQQHAQKDQGDERNAIK